MMNRKEILVHVQYKVDWICIESFPTFGLTMKRNLSIFAPVLTMLILISCQGPKTMPFEADFTGTYTAFGPDSLECGPGSIRVIVDALGENELLGEFTTHFDFCVDENGNYPGNRMVAFILAENGDSLFISSAGQVIEGRQDDHPEFVRSYFRDPFKILGGTGKYKNASGSGMTDDYNSTEDQNSHHSWKGSITIVE